MNTSKQINVMILLVFLAVFATGAYTLWTGPCQRGRGQAARTYHHERCVFTQNCRTCHGDAGEGGLASNRLRIAPALNRQDLQGTIKGEDGTFVRDDIEYATDYKFIYYTITRPRRQGDADGGSRRAAR
jgi:hypothetical protein